jgi:tRNA-2-methylthio-N6-dimethylallyladenosine synthase
VRAENAGDADVILLNTCAIREKAAEKVFSELGRLKEIKERRPQTVLGVCGCVAQHEAERIFERAGHVDFVVGPRATGSLPGLIARVAAGDRGARHVVDVEYREDSIRFPFDDIRREGLHTRKAFVTVIEGCNHRCTFCIVPKTRGREVSRNMDDVLAEVRSLAASGVCEVEFLGQTVNAYRDSAGRTLADLLLAAARIEGVHRIRFTTSHPAQMTEPLMDAMAAGRPKVCPYLHLPAQSGSSRVLRTMRRGYDREAYLRRIDALRSRIPDLSLGTDMIVGFPTETDEDFEDSMTLVEHVEFDTLYSFTYSMRPGTAAERLGPEVPERVGRERLQRLQERQRDIQERRNRAWLGRTVEVLVEGPSRRDDGEWTGRTPEYRIVNFQGDSAPGRRETLRIVGSSPFSLRGASVSGFS